MATLTSLPNEILIQIFGHCKVLPLTLVSKQFNNLISNTPSLMKKFHLLITERSKYLEIAQSKRKHQKVLIKFNYKINSSILEVLKTLKDQIKNLELMRCILTEDLFIEIMESLPNLETLSIYTTYLKSNLEFKEAIMKPLECMKHLRILNFRNSDQKFLYLLKKSSLITTINISLPHQYPSNVITDFLQDHQDVEIIENLMVSEIEQTILLYVLCNMKNLKKLCIEIDKIQMEEIRNLEIENTSIRTLNLYGSPLDPVDFNIIIGFFKNLANLELEINSVLEPINMVQLQRSAPQIKSLKIMNCYGDFFNQITLSNLKIFEIYDISSFSQADWISFSRRNTKIEVLTIKDEAVTNEIFMTITQELRNLRYFEVFYDPQRLTNEILNYICDPLFPQNIRTVKIRKRHWLQYSNSFFSLTTEHKNSLNKNLGFTLILK
ncbi:hypothetical protein ACKWTF_011839 [Chironomus riparius]